MKIQPPKYFLRYLKPLAAEARRRGVAIYGVGGCVRDWILGAETKDLDLVMETDPTPLAQFCARRWGGAVESFGRFGTIRFHAGQKLTLPKGGGRGEEDGFRIDFVRARAETYPAPAALPVVRPGSLAEDLARRDFTVNAMAARLDPDGDAELIDLHDGRGDIRRRIIRVLRAESFRDDSTRIFRAARYSCRYRMKLESETEALVRKAEEEGYAKLLSRERLRNELLRILSERDPLCSLRKLKAWNLTSLYHPRFVWPGSIDAGKNEWERLGMIAIEMERRSTRKEGGCDGSEFIPSLNLERPVSRAILEALAVDRLHASPRGPLDPLARRILELACGRGAKAALRPLLLAGKDLQGLGLRPGPDFNRILESAAQAQWKGTFSTRIQALRWLQSRISS